MTEAKFSIGEIVHHKLFDYRGVIIDVDFQFLGTDEWYENVARSRPAKNKPWYHVLVDNAVHQTYVAEQNLEESSNLTPINHPLVEHLFSDLENRGYQIKVKKN